MYIKYLKLRNFRNYAELGLELSAGLNTFLGPNAQGKTNVVEAVYYGSLGHSHRTRADKELIRWGQDGALIEIVFVSGGVERRLEFQLSPTARRRILLNGAPVRPRELVGNLDTVLFSPEDLWLVKGAPAGRRRFLDAEISQARPAYYKALLEYNKIVTQRNSLLKSLRESRGDRSLLPLWDEQLARQAALITTHRLAAVHVLSRLAGNLQRDIEGGEELSIAYELHGLNDARHIAGQSTESLALLEQEGENVTRALYSWYNKELANKRELDIIRGTTSRGPHHDDIVLSVDGRNLKAFGSQGQQRTGGLALKLAELEFLQRETGEYPVLLLDDVMSELDVSRRRQLVDYIARQHIQTLITATDEAYFPDGFRTDGHAYRVCSGQVQLLQ